MKKIVFVVLSFMFIFILVGCRTSTLTKIKLSEVTHSVFYAPQYVAMTKGYFKDEGLDLEVINSGGADKVMAALLSRDVQIGLMGPEATVYVYLQGQENYIVNFIQLTQRDGSFIVAREPIENFTIQMLKDKSILGGRKGGMPEMTLEYVIKQAGLTLAQNSDEADVNVRTDIAFTAQAGAFANGEGDFTTLFEPLATQMENEGKGYVVGSVGALSGSIPYTAYSATKSYLTENPEILEKFTRAIYRGQKFVQENDDRTVAEAMAPHFSDVSLEVLIDVVARYRAIDAWCHTPFFAEEGLDKLMDVMQLAGELEERAPFEKIVNNTFANKIIGEDD